jgi:hypothetical protein
MKNTVMVQFEVTIPTLPGNIEENDEKPGPRI